MAEERPEDGTEEPTQRRREQARSDGQVVQSPEVASAFALLTSGLILLWFGPSIGGHFADGIRLWLTDSVDIWSTHMDTVVFRWITSKTLALCGIPILIMLVISFSVAFIQTGPMFVLTPLSIKLDKLQPANNWKRLMSMDNALKSVLAMVKVGIAFSLTILFCYWNWQAYGTAIFSTLFSVITEVWREAILIWIVLAAIFLTPAAIDYFFKRYQQEQKLKMTKEEIKREQKDEGGDPVIKAKRRQKAREELKQRSVADVPTATVVLTNPTHLAVALKYEAGMAAPKVVAKGAGVFAKNIMKIAKDNKIPVIQRKPLARAIYKNIRVGQEIPPEFFKAVAEILGQIYRLRKSFA